MMKMSDSKDMTTTKRFIQSLIMNYQEIAKPAVSNSNKRLIKITSLKSM